MKVNNNNEQCDSHCEEEFFIDVINAQETPDQVFADISLQNETGIPIDIHIKLDTGAQVNIIPKSLASKIPRLKILKSNQHLTSYTGQKLNVIGRTHLHCHYKGRSAEADFYIVDTNAPPIASLQM